MHDAVQRLAIPPFPLPVAKHASSQRGPVDFARGVPADADGHTGVERLQEVRCRGAESFEDARVAAGAGEDDAAGEEVGVDDGEVVGWGVEEGGDGGFAGC